ncbi:flagellar assembly protein H [Geobacillus sp. BCO2]|nr:flagellar assembly protein H [Geobacillus sp. BCO2]
MSNVIKAPNLAARAGKKTIVVQRHASDLPSSVDDRQREMEAVAAAKEEAAELRRQAEQYYESVREQLAREKEEWQREKERLIEEARAAGMKTAMRLGVRRL